VPSISQPAWTVDGCWLLVAGRWWLVAEKLEIAI
jgi:hypothetical protein